MEEASATGSIAPTADATASRDDATSLRGRRGGGGGRLHGDRRRSAATIRKDEEGGARPGPADAVAARSASEDTTTSEIRENEFQSHQGGKYKLSYWVSAGAGDGAARHNRPRVPPWPRP